MTSVTLEALRQVQHAGGRIALTRLAERLAMTRAELDRVLAYADDERRRLLGVELDARTGAETVVLTRAGDRRLRSARPRGRRARRPAV